MTDTELVDFVDKRGIQVWPERKRTGTREIFGWWAQSPHPVFMQIAKPTWRMAVEALRDAMKKHSLL